MSRAVESGLEASRARASWAAVGEVVRTSVGSWVMVWMVWLRATSFELTATQRAVSTLSPVSIQILIPALRRSSREGLTSFWSLSSTPVTPRSSRLRSRCVEMTVAMEVSREVRESEASLYAAAKSPYCCAESLRRPTTRVRKPSRAMLAVSSSSQSFAATMLVMTVSAPFW